MFLRLPPELRIEVYRIIIDRTIVIKDPTVQQASQLYRGLLFSCKQVLVGYNAEAEQFVQPVDSIIYDSWDFDDPMVGRPFLMAPTSKFSYPTHIQISLPIVLLYSMKHTRQYMNRIMGTLKNHRTRVIFSIDAATWPCTEVEYHPPLVDLYNIICSIVVEEKHTFPSGPLLWFVDAEAMWVDRGFQLKHWSLPPIYGSDQVALHVQKRNVVFDAHMSEHELRSADSGHLWEVGNRRRRLRLDHKARREGSMQC